MKRLHVHLSVADLDQGIDFYSTIFGCQPDKIKSDYAKWQLDDPRVNFAISTRSQSIGLDHLGIQADVEQDIVDARDRLNASNISSSDINSGICCYAQSSRFWTLDPAGIPWENFVTMNDAEVYGSDKLNSEVSAGCEPAASTQSTSCC